MSMLQDEEFLYRRGGSVAFKPVPKTLLQGKDATVGFMQLPGGTV
jgi:hypothetical protein